MFPDCHAPPSIHGRDFQFEFRASRSRRALLLAWSSFVAAGIAVELFSEVPIPDLPAGVTRRNAREILDRDVALYRHEFDGPSPALHANHFRYALLERLGGWWVDTD